MNILLLLLVLPFVQCQTNSPHLLKCCRLISEPFVYSNSTVNNDNNKKLGWTDELFNALETHQSGNFKFKCNLQTQEEYENITHDEFIKEFSTCEKTNICKCDIGISSFIKTAVRTQLVDFLPAHGYNSLYLVTEKSNLDENKNTNAFFVRAFEDSVWYAILGLVVFFTLLHLLDDRFPGKKKKSSNDYRKRSGPDIEYATDSEVDNTSNIKKHWEQFKHFLLNHPFTYKLRRAIQATLSKLVGFNLNDLSEGRPTFRMWLLSYLITLCGIFLILVYEAAMIATLLQEGGEPTSLSVNHIKECSKPDSDFCFKTKEGIEQYWDNVISKQSCRKGSNVQPKKVDKFSEILDMLAAYKPGNDSENTCKYMLAEGGIAGRAIYDKKYCGKLQIIGGPFVTREVSFIVRKDFKFTKELEKSTLQLQSIGRYNQSLQEYIEQDNSNCNISNEFIVDFNRLKYFFYFVFIVCAILALVMLDKQNPIHSFEDERLERLTQHNTDARCLSHINLQEHNDNSSDFFKFNYISISRKDDGESSSEGTSLDSVHYN